MSANFSAVKQLGTRVPKTFNATGKSQNGRQFQKAHYIVGHFTCWISLWLRPKTKTKRLKFGLSLELTLTNHRSAVDHL